MQVMGSGAMQSSEVLTGPQDVQGLLQIFSQRYMLRSPLTMTHAASLSLEDGAKASEGTPESL